MTRRVQSVLCIGCPTGCSGEVLIEDGVVVELHGYTCKRGRAYIREEVIAPKRMVTTTVRVNGGALALLPVVSDRPVPKESIFACLALLRKVTVTAPAVVDSVVLADALGLGVNFVASRDCPSFGSPAWIEASPVPAPAPPSEPEELEELESPEGSEGFEGSEFFEKQFGLLRNRLLNDPKSLRQMFIDDGTQAIVWEFRQNELGADFTKRLWDLLLRDDDMSTILQRFILALPLPLKRKFVAGLDAHLSDRYPMFKGLSQAWPVDNSIPPRERSAGQPAHDSGRVAMGYGTLGYSQREVDLLAWLEALRDK